MPVILMTVLKIIGNILLSIILSPRVIKKGIVAALEGLKKLIGKKEVDVVIDEAEKVVAESKDT